MNTFWLVLWLAFSLFITGAFLWSSRILFEQKKAWKAFAGKYKLPFEKGRMLSSPVVKGDFKSHRINIYSEEQRSEDARGTRFRSVIELMRKSDADSSGAIANGHLKQVIDLFDLHDIFKVESPGWSPDYVGRSSDNALMERYITPQRFEYLNRLLKIRKGAFLIIYNPDDLLLRFETSDPLRDPRHIDRLVKMMLEASENLREPVKLTENTPAERKDKADTPQSADNSPEPEDAEQTPPPEEKT